MKKLTALLLAAVVALSMAACSIDGNPESPGSSSSGGIPSSQKPDLPEGALDVEDLGVAFTWPAAMEPHLSTLVFADTFGAYEVDGVEVEGSLVLLFQSEEVYQRVLEIQASEEPLGEAEFLELQLQTREFASIIRMKEATVAAFTAAGKDLSQVTGYPHNELLGQEGEAVYYLAYEEMDTSNLEPSSAEIYQTVLEAVPALKETVILYTPPETVGFRPGNVLEGISAKDFDGKAFTEADFAKNTVTLVNVWGTYCPPCIEEMPDLERIYRDYEDRGLGVLGICGDTDGNRSFSLAKDIVGRTGVTYRNLIPDPTITALLQQDVDVIPTTFFVDSSGKVVGKLLTGKRTYEQLVAEIEPLLVQE